MNQLKTQIGFWKIFFLNPELKLSRTKLEHQIFIMIPKPQKPLTKEKHKKEIPIDIENFRKILLPKQLSDKDNLSPSRRLEYIFYEWIFVLLLFAWYIALLETKKENFGGWKNSSVSTKFLVLFAFQWKLTGNFHLNSSKTFHSLGK